MTAQILRFPLRRVVWIVRGEFWSVRAPASNVHLFADRGDAWRFARRVAANLNIDVREQRA